MTIVFVPEWVDCRTAEWCAELCERVEVRILPVDKRPGARACAVAIRAALTAARPALPVPIEDAS